ncbi:MAG: S8 family serine peptidase [Pseudomonadota bacterium]
MTGCGHGTHVASTAMGFQRGNHGVARRADLASVQVFSRFDSTSDCGSSAPCVLAFNSDQILGLEQVLKWKQNGRKIAAVNMSLGGGRHESHCDSDPRKAIIDQLKSVHVAVVIASGNSSFDNAVGAPACISTAVTVGSTDNSDAMSSFSNVDEIVDLNAPGSNIRAASEPGSNTALRVLSGTSMATPHVAGAFALLKAALPSAGVDAIERALKCTGLQVQRNNTPKPRIQVHQAYEYLKKPDRKRIFNFNQSASVKQFNRVLGQWFHLGKFMRVVANRNQTWYLAQAPFCANDIKVTAELKRLDPDTVLNWASGIMLSSGASDDGKMVGLAFLYYVSQSNETTAAVFNFEGLDGVSDSGAVTNLCSFRFNGKNLGQKRKLVAIKRENNLIFRIDGREVCNVSTDARFTDGHVAVLMAAPQNDTGHKLDVHSLQLQTFKQSSTVTAVSSASQPAISGSSQSAVATSLTGAASVSN